MNKAIPFLIIFVTVTTLVASAGYVHAATYTYTFHGPYYDDGSVAVETVGVGILWVNGSVYRFTMTEVGGVANTSIITSSAAAVEILWNASSTLNFTRIIDLTGATSEEYNIYIPSAATPAGQYYFSVTDFMNMQNVYLQSSISTDGSTSHVVERRSLNSTGTVTFTMAQYGTYTLTIQSNLGSYTQQFVAENIFSINIPVLAGAFPVTNTTQPTFTAQRLNSSLIGIAYSDPSNSTDWFYLNITHRSGASTIYDYNTNASGSSQSILWNAADADKAYTVTATAKIAGVEKTWIMAVPKTAPANPFSGLFDWIGQYIPTLPHVQTGWPEGMTSVQIAQLAASAIIMFFLCVGSFRSVGATCLLAWIVGGVMLVLGWWGGGTAYASIPEFALAGFLSILVAIDESKQTVREA